MEQKQNSREGWIQVRELKIGDGIPKIIVPIVETTEAAILAKARRLCTEDCVDAVEWRVDFYEHAMEPEKVVGTLSAIREALGKLPVLVTFRTKQEGGEREISRDAYYALNLAAAKSGKADLVDVEIDVGEDVADHIAQLHGQGVTVIGSKHDFEKTPSDEAMTGFLERAWALGADIPKLAVMPKSWDDVMRLMNVTKALHDRHGGKPLITMSMSEQGVISRLYGEVFGSAMTFGTLGQASAPGQVPAQALRWALKHLHTANTEEPEMK